MNAKRCLSLHEFREVTLMLLRRRSPGSDESPSNLTAMIDIVFLLLVFFVMTFRVVVSEGDFSIKAPPKHSATSSVDQTFVVPLQIELKAGPNGQLTGIRLDGRPIEDVAALSKAVRQTLVFDGDAAATIRCPPALRYEHTIAVVGAIHGPPESRLVESIRLERL